MKLIDPDHPFYAPLWRRLAIVAVTLAWSGFEFLAGSTTWGAITGAIGLFCIYQFFIAFDPKDGNGG